MNERRAGSPLDGNKLPVLTWALPSPQTVFGPLDINLI